MNSTLREINRRSFIKTAAPFALCLPTITRSQQPIERGRFSADDVPLARAQLLKLVNQERAQLGLSALELDELACKVAADHALDMVSAGFLSHWGTDGRKPYQRYSFAGGIDATQENVGLADNIQSVTPNSVMREIAEIHTQMFLEEPPNDGHRRAIVSQFHTHVGFGFALKDHNLRLAELYVSRYLRLDPFPPRAQPKTTVVLTGKLLNAKHFLHEVDVCYEPLPTPPESAWLRTPRAYGLPEDFLLLRPKTPIGMYYTDGTIGDYDSADGKFRVPARLYKDAPGVYTVVFWIRRARDEKPFPATGICITSD
jgi:uncharacterized protein YkwD